MSSVGMPPANQGGSRVGTGERRLPVEPWKDRSVSSETPQSRLLTRSAGTVTAATAGVLSSISTSGNAVSPVREESRRVEQLQGASKKVKPPLPPKLPEQLPYSSIPGPDAAPRTGSTLATPNPVAPGYVNPLRDLSDAKLAQQVGKIPGPKTPPGSPPRTPTATPSPPLLRRVLTQRPNGMTSSAIPGPKTPPGSPPGTPPKTRHPRTKTVGEVPGPLTPPDSPTPTRPHTHRRGTSPHLRIDLLGRGFLSQNKAPY